MVSFHAPSPSLNHLLVASIIYLRPIRLPPRPWERMYVVVAKEDSDENYAPTERL